MSHGSITRRGSSNRKAGVVDYEYGGSEMDEHEKSEAVKATVTLDNPGKKPFIMTREFWHDWMPGWVPICLAILSAVTGGSWWAAQDHTSITRDVQDLKNGQAEQKIVLDTMRKDQLRLMFRLHIPYDDDGKPEYYTMPAQPAAPVPKAHSKVEDPFLMTAKKPPLPEISHY